MHRDFIIQNFLFMKTSILSIGKVLEKTEQQAIHGGNSCPNPNSCQDNPCGICPAGFIFHEPTCACHILL